MDIQGVIHASKTVSKRAAAVVAGKGGMAVAAPRMGALRAGKTLAGMGGRAVAGNSVGIAGVAGKVGGAGPMVGDKVSGPMVGDKVAGAAGVERAAGAAAAGMVGKAGGVAGAAGAVAKAAAPAAGKAVGAPGAAGAVGKAAGAGAKGGAMAGAVGAVGVVEGAMGAPVEAKKSAADVMEADKGFQAVKANAKHDATKAKQHEGGAKKAADAQGAAKGPAGEAMSKAKDKHSDAMDQQEPGVFSQEKFKAALRDKISSLKIDTLEDADNFKKNDGAAAVKGDMQAQVGSEKDAATGGMTSTVKAEPDASSEQPKVAGPDPVAAPNIATTPVNGQAAAPKPVPDADISLQKGSQELDHQMADANVSEKQLNKANEPNFSKAVQSKGAAQKDALEQPGQFRKTEKAVVAQSQTAAVATGHAHLGSMVAGRKQHMSAVLEKQNATKAKDEANRKMVSDEVNKRFDATKTAVEGILTKLDDDAKKNFDDGIAEATRQFEDYVDKKMDAYKDDRYSGLIGKGRWIADKLTSLPDEVNVFYKEGKNLYIKYMDGVIDRVSKIVADGLNGAKKRINEGKLDIKKYVDGLPKDLQKLGQDTAKEIGSKFTELENSVNDKEGELVDALAQKYKAGMEAVNKRIDEMKAANVGLIDKAKAFIKEVINTIIELKNMLLNVLARAAAAIGLIIEDPIGFLGNLVAGVKMGINNFLSNIVTHLKEGLLGWLFGAIADAGIELPKSFDLKGILSLIFQVLGLTYKNIRARAVNIVGEKVVATLEKAAEIFIIIKNEGFAGVWKWIVDKVTALKDTVLESIKDFVITKIITAGITWLISLLNPASAFIKACKAIYDVIMFFVERGKQIIALINAVIDSVTAIAKGAINVAADMVEGALAKALPIAISFLASLLGLGGISEKIKGIIEKIQAPINLVIDWVINKAVGLLKAAGKLFGIGGKDDKKDGKGDKDADSEHSPEKQAKIDAGLVTMHEEEKKYMKDGEINKEDADKVAATVKGKHPVFSSFFVREKGEKIQFVYTASPEKVADQVDENDMLPKKPRKLKIGMYIRYKPGNQMEGSSDHPVNVYVIHSVDKRTKFVFLMSDDGYVKKPFDVDKFQQQFLASEFEVVSKGEIAPKKLSEFPLVTLNFYSNGMDVDSYKRQLILQQRGLNATSLVAWSARKTTFESQGRDTRSGYAQQRARDDDREQRISLLTGQGKKQKEAESIVEAEMKKEAALHGADQVAGGHYKGLTGLGSRSINSSIGSQWAKTDGAAVTRDEKLRNSVAAYMGTADFKKAPEAEQGKVKLNVSLDLTNNNDEQ